MIIDINAWAGSWGTFPVEGEVQQVKAALKAAGVGRFFLSPMHAAWCHNPHLCNELVYQAAARDAAIVAMPVLDPTIPTWAEEFNRAVRLKVRCIKLLPAYSCYTLQQAEDLLVAAAKTEMRVMVQTRLEDPRRQHPLAQVPDVPVKDIVDAARRFPEVKFVIGGASSVEISKVKDELFSFPNLFADTSQLDGVNAVATMVESGLGGKLLFGSHAPFFIPLAGIARVINDLDDSQAAAIFSANLLRIMA
jgi:predicted TIM-barrel fold metal-dependent hydrolase